MRITSPATTNPRRHHGMRAALSVFLSASLALTMCVPMAFGAQAAEPQDAALGTTLASSEATFGNHDIIQIRPHGYYRTVNVEGDGGNNGKDVWLYSLGTSSKQKLRSTDSGYFTIQAQRQFTETDNNKHSYWDVEGASKKGGAKVHVWSNGADATSSQWRFERNSDGTYYIQNRNSGLYLSLEDKKDENKSNLIQDEKTNAITWDVDTVYGNQDASTHSYASSWMSRYSDKLLLSDMTIPGTHDSGTCYTYMHVSAQESFTTCQQYYIDEQLTAGIRFFDIRVGIDGLEDRDPYINHGGTVCLDRNDKWLRLSAVVKDMKSFLEANPSETVIMMVSNSNGDTDNQTSSLYKQISDNPGLFYTSSKVPTLGEARGKIVLFTRFEPSGDDASKIDYGLCLSSWGSYNDAYKITKGLVRIKSGSDLDVWVQDNYGTNADDKIAYVQGAFAEADSKRLESASLGRNAYVINYTSCTSSNPFSAARNMNERLYNEGCLKDDTPGFLGIVVMDFIDARQAESVWKQNSNELAESDEPVVGTTAKGLVYKISGNSALITGYTGSSSSVTIPKTIKGKPVVSAAVGSAGIKVLKLGKASELRTLECTGNKIARLDVTKNAKLTTLLCQNNRLSSIKLSATGNKLLKKGVFVIGKKSQNKLSKAQRASLATGFGARSYPVSASAVLSLAADIK
ncbi:MAG: phosphatidylinositol-specific phospholipase C domain-containing protein [Coriobacteriales bacterium]